MADIFDRVDFRFSPNTTDAQRRKVIEELQSSHYNTIVGAAGVENAFLSVQPNGYFRILMQSGEDPDIVAAALRRNPAIAPDSVLIRLKRSDDE